MIDVRICPKIVFIHVGVFEILINYLIATWLILFSGSPPIHGEEGEDTDADDTSDFNYPSGNQDQKQKISERMLTWRQGQDGRPKYDSGEIPRYAPSLTASQVL